MIHVTHARMKNEEYLQRFDGMIRAGEMYALLEYPRGDATVAMVMAHRNALQHWMDSEPTE